MRVGYIILADAAEANIDENWFLLDNQSTCNSLIDGNIHETSETILAQNIYVSTAMQD